MSYNPEYYGASEVQGTERELYKEEINVVENIQKEQENKDALIKADESKYPAQVLDKPRELYPEEINVVENIKNYSDNKASIITQDDEEVQMSELKNTVAKLQAQLASKP